MSDRKVKSISCTNCGAPLTLHGGGHKIQTLNCQYCGSVLDAKKDYAILAKYSEQELPFHAPLDIGMQGNIKGVDFTIIGIVCWKTLTDAYPWTDYQLFSPTHGYATLSYEMGHWIFGRRTRYLPKQPLKDAFISAPFQIKDQTFQVLEKYKAKITYVAGELTWVAGIGDTIAITDAINPPFSYSEEYSRNEVEYHQGEYLPADTILESFNAEEKYPPTSQHALQPYVSKYLAPMAKASKYFFWIILAAVLLIWMFMAGSITPVKLAQVTPASNGYVEVSHAFKIDKPGRLTLLQMDTRNADELINPRIHKDGLVVLKLGNQNKMFTPAVGQASQRVKVISKRVSDIEADFTVPMAGEYRLSYLTKQNTSNKPSNVRITIKQGYVSPFYFILLLFALVVIIIYSSSSRRSFEANRWHL